MYFLCTILKQFLSIWLKTSEKWLLFLITPANNLIIIFFFFKSISAGLILMKAFFSLDCLTIKPKPHQEQTQYVQRHSLPKGKVIPSWIHGRSLYSFHTSKWVLRQNFLVQFLQMIPPALNLSTQDTPNASDQISLVRSPWIFNLHCILLFLLLSYSIC